MRRLRKSGAWDKAGSHGRAVIALTATAIAGLAACSSTPKYANPVELYRSAAGFSLNDDTSGERNAQNLAAGSNEPYPNLGTVPPPPDRAMSSIDRQKLQQGLTEDRARARQSDADLRGSGTATAVTGAPTPITRPGSAANSEGATAETKHSGDPSPPGGGRANASGVHHGTPAGSEPAPHETALNSPDVHTLPEGDTPRPAPPPPSLPLPEKARKSPPVQASNAAKRPAPATQTADMAPPRPAAPATAPAAPAASVPPPPPPDGLMTPPPSKMAAVEPVPSPPPATAAPAPSLPPAAMTAPGAPSLPPLGASDAKKPPSEPSAALDPMRPASAPEAGAGAPQPPAAAPAIPPADPAARIPPPPGDLMMRAPGKTATADSSPALPPAAALIAPGASALAPLGAGDAKKPPSEQTAALWPPSQATPIIPLPAPVKTPEQQAALWPPSQATPIIPLPAPVKTPDQQAVLTPPSQATPRAPERDPVAAEPAPQRTGKGGTVSLQAAEINFVGNGLTLTADDDRRLADVLKLYDKHGGVVRVVGYGRRGYGADAAQQELASFSKAIERANVVAKALAQLGLASNRIVVQAAPVGDGLGEDRAEVLLEF